jgi:hypothetical protein
MTTAAPHAENKLCVSGGSSSILATLFQRQPRSSMHTAFHFLTVISLAIGSSPGHSQIASEETPPPKAIPAAESPDATGGYWEKLVMHPFHDAQGAVVVAMPFPAAWKVARNPPRGEPIITGPNHVKVIDFPLQAFLFTHDPQLQQIYQRGGQRLRPLPGLDQLIQQDFGPWASGQGLEFVRQYEVPEVARIDQWYNDQLYQAMPTDIKVTAIGTEWKHPASGNSYFLLVRLTARSGGGLQSWSYFSNGLQAEKTHFESAKKQFLFGLANARYNPQPIMAYNQAEAQRVGQSWAAHNQRMAQNQANFEASQRAFVNRSAAAHDALMKNWRDQNAAGDRAHERFIDTVTERTKVVDQSTGQQYKVDSGANQYWMNRDGKYFGTDNPNYDPNRDENMNRENWQKLELVE